MNKLKITFLKKAVVLLLAFTLGACNFLDIVPDNVATIDYAFHNRENAERYLYTCYSWRPEIGDIDWDPAMSGGDEIWQFTPTRDGFRIFYGQTLAHGGSQNVTTPIFNFWDGTNNQVNNLWKGIRDCNIFLENINSPLIDQTTWEKTRWISEVKFLKAYYHFYLLKTYGPIPIIDVNLPISASAEEVKVWREPIDDVVEYIVALVREALPGLPNADEVALGSESGRVDKLVALTLIADLRLWAASPLVNEEANVYAGIVDKRGKNLFPTQGDPNKWALAAAACDSAINECHRQGKRLYRVVDPLVALEHQIFKTQTTYRQAICDRWNSELIWGCTSYNCTELSYKSTPRLIRFDAATLNYLSSEWSPTLKIAGKYYSSHGVPIDEDKDWVQNNNWYENRFQIRPEPSSADTDEKYLVKKGEKTVYLHFNREPRFYASIGFDRGIYYGSGWFNWKDDGSATDVHFCKSRNLEEAGFQGGSGYSITGYSAKKMNCFKNTQANNAVQHEYYPFPIYRLADLYLMYAEAVNESEGPDGPNSDKMFAYLNDIRDRAGLEPVKESWLNYSTDPDKPSDKSGLRDIIQRERTIELAFEGKRFWDIRRWRKIDELNEQPQGWNIQGETAEEFYKPVNVFPRKVEFTVKNYFTPISESALNVNDQLIQNYGW
ncbi:MAG: RagB/SusD family nutrient uptake outer membrane protein [Prevotellaceae bacterium]|jgi:hypothetical protein|nr:RagB/SusD family nutrient uptake outer membrane protein [Prevotellaceae bacterium]